MTGIDAMAADLAAWGKVAIIEARGRRSGRRISTPVGFVELADGSLLVAASDDHTRLGAEPAGGSGCRVTIGDVVTQRRRGAAR